MPHDVSLADYALAFAYALFVWWFGTGVVLYIDGLPRRTHRWSLVGATLVLVPALAGLARSSELATPPGAYLAFSCAVLVWAWNELAFLLGFVTGPRKTACPEACGGWRHFGHAIETLLHHELAILASAAAVVALTWGAPNQVGTWTFIALWAMRLSAKLNVFLGVANASEEFLPQHLDYLKHFFAKRPMNLLFPFSVGAASWVTVSVVRGASGPEVAAFDAVGSTLVASLLALAVLEHWFLVLPLPSADLWRWGLRSRRDTRDVGEAGVVRLHDRDQDRAPALEQEVADRRGDR